MSLLTKHFAVFLLLVSSQLALAQSAEDCPRPDALTIQLEGSSASESQIMEAQSQVQTYNEAANSYMVCLEQVAQTAPVENHEGLLELYNGMWAELQSTLEAFNAQVRAYNARAEESAFASAESVEDCPRPETANLNLDGSTANEAEMMEARTTIQAYVNAGESYKECLRAVAQKVTPEEQDVLVELYNTMTEEVQSSVDDFNTQRAAYVARTEQAAQDAQ